jgi:hypothetical protein
LAINLIAIRYGGPATRSDPVAIQSILVPAEADASLDPQAGKQVTTSIVGAIGPKLGQVEIERASTRNHSSLIRSVSLAQRSMQHEVVNCIRDTSQAFVKAGTRRKQLESLDSTPYYLRVV